MKPHHLALATLAFTSGTMAGALPKDPCALLTPAEVQALAGNAKVGPGKPDLAGAPLGVTCKYSWGPRSPQWGTTELAVTVIDTKQAYPNTSANALKQGLLASAKAKGANASEVAGVGDAAVFTVESRSFSAKVDTILGAKGYHVSVSYHHGDSAASKDKIAALAKAAAGRL